MFLLSISLCPISLLNKSVFHFTKVMLNVYKLTNFKITLFTWTLPSCQGCNLSEFSVIQILSYLYVCVLPSEVRYNQKNLSKNIYKNKWRAGEINTIFNNPYFFTKNGLIQFK